MGFNKYLVKIKGVSQGQSDYTFPNEFILLGTYKPIRSVQDKDAYRDEDAVLHRNALAHNIYKMEFQTRTLTNEQYDSIMGNIQARYVDAAERKVQADIYIAEIGGYTGFVDVYLPDPEVTITQIIDDTTLKYAPVRFALIGY